MSSDEARPGPSVAATRVDGVEAQIDIAHHLGHEQGQVAQMFARGHLGHDAAVGPMQVDLRADDLRKDVGRPWIGLDQRHGRLIAGGFDA